MPYINGEYREPTNEDRAGWALAAANEYADQTRMNWDFTALDSRSSDDAEDTEALGELRAEVISDLLGDLMHLCDRYGLDFADLSERGAEHHGEEVREEQEAAHG
jgi:hypothetical protein